MMVEDLPDEKRARDKTHWIADHCPIAWNIFGNECTRSYDNIIADNNTI